jgi:hypothetical protein
MVSTPAEPLKLGQRSKRKLKERMDRKHRAPGFLHGLYEK